jgi:hypothetical protein
LAEFALGVPASWARLERIDCSILAAARQELAFRAPAEGRLAVRASLRNPSLASVRLRELLAEPWRAVSWSSCSRRRWRCVRVLAAARPARRGRPTRGGRGGGGGAYARPAGGALAVAGVWVPAGLAARREQLTAPEVLAERNAERRRVLFDAIGIDRFLATSDAVIVQQDDFGRLCRLEQPGEREPYVAVEVVNATAEPDGSRRRYFLRVPPDMRTSRQAVGCSTRPVTAGGRSA